MSCFSFVVGTPVAQRISRGTSKLHRGPLEPPSIASNLNIEPAPNSPPTTTLSACSSSDYSFPSEHDAENITVIQLTTPQLQPKIDSRGVPIETNGDIHLGTLSQKARPPISTYASRSCSNVDQIVPIPNISMDLSPEAQADRKGDPSHTTKGRFKLEKLKSSKSQDSYTSQRATGKNERRKLHESRLSLDDFIFERGCNHKKNIHQVDGIDRYLVGNKDILQSDQTQSGSLATSGQNGDIDYLQPSETHVDRHQNHCKLPSTHDWRVASTQSGTAGDLKKKVASNTKLCKFPTFVVHNTSRSTPQGRSSISQSLRRLASLRTDHIQKPLTPKISAPRTSNYPFWDPGTDLFDIPKPSDDRQTLLSTVDHHAPSPPISCCPTGDSAHKGMSTTEERPFRSSQKHSESYPAMESDQKKRIPRLRTDLPAPLINFHSEQTSTTVHYRKSSDIRRPLEPKLRLRRSHKVGLKFGRLLLFWRRKKEANSLSFETSSASSPRSEMRRMPYPIEMPLKPGNTDNDNLSSSRRNSSRSQMGPLMTKFLATRSTTCLILTMAQIMRNTQPVLPVPYRPSRLRPKT